MTELVSIGRDEPEELVFLAKAGDLANSQPRLRHRFRQVVVCSDPASRAAGLFCCLAFEAAARAVAV